MPFAQVRSINQAYKEESIEIFEKILSDIPKYLKKQEKSIKGSIRKTAKEATKGDEALEHNICSSFYYELDDYNLYEANLLIIYSFYERTLRRLAQEKTKKSNSYAMNLIQEIKNNGEFKPETDRFITEVDTNYRKRETKFLMQAMWALHCWSSHISKDS